MILSANIGETVVKVLSDWKFWGAIISTLAVIFLGFLLTKKNILKKEWDKVFVKVVMVLGLPALALQGFLSNITVSTLINQMGVLAIGFLFYSIMMFTSRYFFLKNNKDIQDTLAMCVALASTTFFGLPIVSVIFGQEGTVSGNIFNVPYRIFLYSLALMIMSKKNLTATLTKEQKLEQKIKFKQLSVEEKQIIRNEKNIKIKNSLKSIFVNPILIATFIGLFIWITQLIPGIDILKDEKGNPASVLRIDVLFPPINNILKLIAGICTPLAYLAIGMSVASSDIKAAVKSKLVWYSTFIKVLVAPTIILLMAIGYSSIGKAITGNAVLTEANLGALVVMTAAPPASVVVSYAISFDKEKVLASNLSVLSTLMSIIMMPFWIILVKILGSTPLFS
ncbi:AEC family transporter [Spiroplasma endosymbiont of Atherix ibis]|uniref:AEC family transporter n=1 Tax=Spiroplasma endosymbiont of Atherix ibis TaxID=3066291 RepID=UPI0030CAB70E